MIYFAQVNLFLLLLYGCYWLLLRRHTFFVWNRAYLLGSLLLAFALPLVPYPDFAPKLALPTLPVAYELTPSAEVVETTGFAEVAGTGEIVSTPTVPAAPVAPGWGWAEWLLAVYILGVLLMAGRLVWQLRRLRSFIHQSEGLDMGSYRLYLMDSESTQSETSPGEASPGSFSFLRHIVITRRDYEENFDTVLCHELAHVRQRHSWDVLLVEALRVVFWFNPVLVFYKKSLQQVHEYLADREVCAWANAPDAATSTTTTSRDRYAEFMLSYAKATPEAVGLTNPFLNTSHLKNRIIMLYKNKNSNWSLGKYATVALIVGFVSLLAASCEQKTEQSVEQVNDAADQFILIEGVVLDKGGEPMPGTSIVVKGTQTGTTTTAEGEFMLRAPADSELDFSFMGFKQASLKMHEQGTVRVTLAQENASENSSAQRVSSTIGGLKMSQKAKEVPASNYAKDSVFTVVDTQPKFPGGVQSMYKFINDNMKYPDPARRALVQGKVFLTFVVNADGSLQNIKVLKGMGFGTDEEAIRIVKSMPRWIPGADEGEKVNVKFNLPITFDLPKKEAKKQVGMAKPVETEPTATQQPASFNAGADTLIKLKPRTASIDAAARFKPTVWRPQKKNSYRGKSPAEIIRLAILDNDLLETDHPLFVIDGVVSPIELTDYLDNLSPEDIKSVSVLGSDKAKARYGVRGAGGAVSITTKQGAEMPLEIKK